MSFLKSKTFQILNIVSFCSLFLIVVLNLIASWVDLSKPLLIVFISLICVLGLFVLVFNIFNIILLAKEKNNKEAKDEKK